MYMHVLCMYVVLVRQRWPKYVYRRIIFGIIQRFISTPSLTTLSLSPSHSFLFCGSRCRNNNASAKIHKTLTNNNCDEVKRQQKKKKRVKETHRAGGMSWQAHFGRFINKSVGNDFALYIHTLHTRPVHRHINQMVWLCLGPAMRWTLLFMCSALFCKPLQPHSRPPKWIRRLFQLCLCL